MSADALVPIPGERRSVQSDPVAILIDSRCFPVSPSMEALRVLLYPREIPPNGKGRRLAAQRLRALFPNGPLAGETVTEGELLSGRRCYLYRIYRFGDSISDPHAPAAVIVLERYQPPLTPPPASLVPYRLTVREEQVLRLVLTGLSNRQIAERIGISPNTVKVFLRLIMTKMEVTSRFGILGKLLGRAELHGKPPLRPASASGSELRLAGNL
jgi:DNA-binding CsgD family transcriptional regulator